VGLNGAVTDQELPQDGKVGAGLNLDGTGQSARQNGSIRRLEF